MIDIDTLTELIIATSRVDRTEPDPKNYRNGWRTDVLFQTMDLFLIVLNYDPAALAEMGRQVLARVSGFPEIAVLAQLAIFRGERLLLPNPEREKSIFKIMQETEIAISTLPESTKKTRCKSLFEYHVAGFAADYGHFDLAAEAQTRSAQEAKRLNDRSGAAISNFLESVNILRHALCLGKSANKLEEIFMEMEKRFRNLSLEVRKSDLEIKSAENGSVHMIEACLWLDKIPPYWEELVIMALTATNKLGKSSEPIAQFVRAVDMDRRKDPQSADALRIIGKGNDYNERRATVLLILERRALQAGRIDEAINLVSQMPEQGSSRHVIAIAKRALQNNT